MRPLILLLAGFISTGCAGTTSSGAASLELDGTVWALVALPGREPLPDHPITLRFEAGRVRGSDGCNSYSGPYTVEGAEFRLSGSTSSTQMACPEPVMGQADAYLDALAAARAARNEGGRLTLLAEDGAPTAEFVPQEQSLADTEWQVTGYNNGKHALVSVLEGTTLTLAFAADGKLSGSAGCNRFAGAYASSGRDLTIGKLATTRMMCAGPEGVMEQEARFVAALAVPARVLIEADRLELRTREGSMTLTAVRTQRP